MEPKNYAHYWCSRVVELLIELGVSHFFIAPGSRSTPIISAIVRNKKARVFSGIDERAVSFMALGYSKRSHKPSVVVVTSGTAVANIYPAVVEAHLSEIPLLVLTADRPFELRDCGANQTIVQTNMFANHINKSFDLAPPSSVVPLRVSTSIVERALLSTMQPHKGPVHVNVQLREPVSNLPHNEQPWSPHEAPKKSLLAWPHTAVERDMQDVVDVIAHKKGLIIVGELMPTAAQQKILSLAEKLSWPIFADVTSNMRFLRHPNLISHFDLALLNDAVVKKLDVDIVLKFGARMVSKRMWAWIEKNEHATCIAVSESFQRIDHVARFSLVQVPNLEQALDGLLCKTSQRVCGFLSELSECSERVALCIQHLLEENVLNEAHLAARLIAQISEPTNLFVSSSMPIRDLDQFPTSSDTSINIFSSRGASGIDGVISSAVGVAIADVRPCILVIGDMAFIHDTNGLMLLNQASAPMLIIVINNNGGGIFHFLPISSEPDVLTPFIDSPHNVDISALCAAHGISFYRTNPMNFTQALHDFYRERTTRVVEVTIDKVENVRLHKMIYQHIATLA